MRRKSALWSNRNFIQAWHQRPFASVALGKRPQRRQRLGEQASAMFTEDFAGRILGFDGATAPAYAALVGARQRAGQRLNPVDGMIAAIAHVHGAAIATRDGDFTDCGVPLIKSLANPVSPSQIRVASRSRS